MMIKAFLQARMSSSRFPGKVLAPVNGVPMISRVVEAAARVVGADAVIVATSTEPSDDPLAAFLDSLHVKVFRGPLDNVFARFRLCLEQNPCDWFFRLSADSPLMSQAVLQSIASHAQPEFDLVTNVQKRTFPKGHSAELVKSDRFASIDPARPSVHDKEHVTTYYYSHPEEFRILNIENTDSEYARLNFAVDTVEDLARVEQLTSIAERDFAPAMIVSQP